MIKLILKEDTFENFLTAIYFAFYSKKEVVYIGIEDFIPLDMLTEKLIVETDLSKFSKVEEAIVTKIDPIALSKIYALYLSNYDNKGLLCFNYLKKAFKLGSDIHKHLYLKEVKDLNLIERKVKLESHRFTGFLRFSLIQNQFLYSVIEPDNNILELISPHFERRFKNEYWIIHDTKRNLASIYNKISWEIYTVDSNTFKNLESYNDEFEDLWVNYFKSTTIDERKNLKLQRNKMPKRYWKNILEVKN